MAGTGNVSILGAIVDGRAVGGLTYAGDANLTLSGTNLYTGITTIDSGTVTITTDQTMTGALRFGSTNAITTTGTLDLTNANASFGGAFTVQTNSASANNLIIGVGKTLSIGGNVAIGSTATALTNTNLTATGGGSMVVSNLVSSSSFIVGGSTSGTAGTIVTADFSGLSNLSVSLNPTNGIVRVNPVSSTNINDRRSTLILPGTGAGTTTMTAATLAVGDSSQNNDTVAPFEQTNQLLLGSGVNTFNFNTVNIGTGGRDAGAISFNTASGSLVLRDAAGTGPVAFNMGTGSSTTGAGAVNVFDVSGHNADLLFGAVNIGTQTGRVGAMTNVFSFDQGTLVMASLNLSSRNTAAGTTSTFNIGGGTVTSGPITMATTGAAAGVAVANLNITGGTVTMTGHILKGGGAGTDTANFVFDGSTAVLDLAGFTLGGAGANALDSVTIGAGTLRNLGEFNGGADLVKNAAGTLSMDGTNTYTGSTLLEQGTIIAVGGANNRLSTAGLLVGSGTNSGVFQMGTAAGASSQTFTSLASSGTGLTNAIVGGNASFSTLTINQSANTTFNGAIGGSGTNQNQLNLVKDGVGELVISGPRTYTGTTVVSGGKLFIDGYAGPTATTTSLTLADGTEFSLRGTSPSNHVVYGFSGTGNVMTVGSSTGATLGFALDGAFNTQFNLGAGQTMTLNGTLTTAIYVNNAPNAGQQYVLINGADDGSIFGSGTFNLNPVVFNGGSFTYALSQITAGAGEKWVLIPSAQAAADDVWWKGDLTGIATGVWSASLTSGTGFPTNWDDSQSGGVDALVPPDSGSIVHFSATGAANLATTLGANLTIQELIFHAGGTAISIGSSGGINTLTLGNTVNASGLTLLTGAPNVSFSANVALAQSQAWNIADSTSTLTLSGGLSGVGPLSINSNGASTGTVILTGASGLATHVGGTNLVTGRMILEGGADDRLPTNGALTMGNATLGALLQLGDAVNGASNTSIGTLNTGAATTNAIVGGNPTTSTLTINQGTAGMFNGILGGSGTHQNNLALVKSGPATLVLNGINTYLGVTTVTQGTLQLGATGGITQSAALNVNALAGATAALDVNGRTVTLLGGITLSGADSAATPQILDTATGGMINLGGNVVYDGLNNPLGGSIASALNLGTATRTFTANDSTAAATDLTLSGNITTDAASTVNGVSMIVDGTGTGLITGSINLANGTTNGDTADFTKNGTGTWTLQNTITVGDNAVFTAGTFNINTGGSVVFNATPGTTSPDFVLDGTAPVVNLNTANAIVGNSATNIVYVRDNGTLNVNAGGAFGASIEELRLGDDNQGIGNVVLNADISVPILTLGFNSATEVGNVTGPGTISGLNTLNLDNGMVSSHLTGVGNIDKDSLTVTLSGNNQLTGTTLVREGNLILDFAANNNADSKIGTGNLTMGSTTNNDVTALLTLSSNSTGPSLQTVANLTSGGGSSHISLVSNGGQDMVLRVTGTLARTAGSLNLNLPDAATKIEYTGGTTNTNGIVGGWMTMNDRDFVTISGGQLLAATYTVQNDASLWTTNGNITNSAGGFSGTVPLNCNTINSLRFDAAAVSNITVGGTLIVSSGGIMQTASVGANASAIAGGNIVSGTGVFQFHQNNSASLLTVSSNLLGGAAINKNGAGTLLLSGTNVTGAVTIDEGILRLSGGNALSDTSAVNIRGIANTGLEIAAGAGNSETIGSLAGDGVAGVVIIGTGATLTLNQTGSGTFSGVISGAGNLVKNGGATLTISGDASLTGTLTINGGRITMNGGSGAINDTTAYVLNGGELHTLQDQSANENRIRDTSPITLNNTGGTNGLFIENTYATTAGPRVENVGAVTLGFGSNTITATPTNNATATTAEFLATSINQGANHGTLLVRGLGLGDAAAGRKGMIRSTATIANVGGGGAAGTQNISIVPWIVGDRTTSTGFGNSLVTYVNATQGLRPLLNSEYTTNAAGFNGLANATPSNNNLRFDANPGATLTSTASSINSLVLDATATIAITGPANSIEITSGAILAANTGNHSLGGFTGVTTGGGRDYIVSVTTAASTFTVDAALTSNVPLVKSGAGTLRLTNASNAFTDSYLNQGTVLTSSLSRLGSGTINFYGGGLKLEAGWVDDLSTRTLNIGTGGGTLDVALVTAGVTLTNGLDDLTPNASDVLHLFSRSTGTGSTGQLTIQGSSTFTGTTILRNTTVNSGVTNSVVLNGDTNAAINGNIELGNITNISDNFDVVLALGANEQIVDTAVMTFRGASGENAYFKLLGFTETVAGISGTTNEGVIENIESTETGVTTNGKLIVNSSDDYSYTGYMRNRGSGSNAFLLEFEKQGIGTQTLVGTRVTYTGATTISGGTLRLTDTTGFASNITNNATLDLNGTTGTWTLARAISGTGVVMKSGSGTVVLSGANIYSGETRIEQGILSISASGHLGDESATNTIRIANGATLQSTGANVDLGSNRTITLAGTGGTLEVTGTNTLTQSGLIVGDACHTLTKVGDGRLVLSNAANSSSNPIVVSGGTLQVGVLGSGTSGTGMITVGTGATLAGTGNVQGLVSLLSGGVLQAGDVTSVGTSLTTVTGNATLSLGGGLMSESGGSIVLDVTSSTNSIVDITWGGNDYGTPGWASYVTSFNNQAGNHDRLLVNGSVTLAAGTEFIVNPVGFTPMLGQIFNLIDWVGITGFAAGSNTRDGSNDGGATDDLNLPDISGSGLQWDVSQFQAHGIIAVVPEPSRVILLLLGAGLVTLRRRRSAP